MERISFLQARRWDGSWVQICGPEVSIEEQRKKFFNEFRPLQEHPEFNAILMFQTKGGQEFWHFIHKRSVSKKTKGKAEKPPEETEPAAETKSE